ncbi:hypothetical protein BTO20_37655 (plasmid) [Mycobacterium dioxanotrophicus]|jgi:hypothetical protein|uniref:Uncharacterized protein n=1 Tax=Mycobacterium dioxanotrophicus TaxID=482462 RepID=A0A1Y0CGE1_9MYCO|nr:hypothetical protein [Mycobacterium dioxanotrophicus]ART74348.1 hypothetical protein BTO20_37655 [Mycobacterium dioxanotrophicus]
MRSTTLVFAEKRASWILNNAGEYGFQRRRGDLLKAEHDNARRDLAGVDFNVHMQGITEKWHLRKPQSLAAWKETGVVVGCAAIFPLAWPLGRTLYRWMARRITPAPATADAIPITMLAWIAAAMMLLGSILVDPSSGNSFWGVLFLPWIVVQGAGTFLMASVYGVLEGWLAIPGATDWWPFPPPPPPTKKASPNEPASQASVEPVKPRPRVGPPRRPWE